MAVNTKQSSALIVEDCFFSICFACAVAAAKNTTLGHPGQIAEGAGVSSEKSPLRLSDYVVLSIKCAKYRAARYDIATVKGDYFNTNFFVMLAIHFFVSLQLFLPYITAASPYR